MSKQIITERTNLLEPNIYIGLYAQLEERPPVDRLKQAIQNAFMANELTMSKIIIDTMGQAYYKRIKRSGCKVIISQKDWKTILLANEKQPFAIKEGELMRAFITLEGVFLMAHHLVGDGKSIIVFLQDVLLILEGIEVEYKPANIISKQYLQNKAKLNYLSRSYAKYLNTLWKKETQCYSWNLYDVIHKDYWEKHTSCILTHTFTENETAHMIEMARKVKVTLNSYLIGVVLCIRKDLKRIGIPIDIRENDTSMSNQVSGIELLYQYNEKKPIQENAKLIHSKIYKVLPKKKYFVLLFLAKLCPNLIDSVLLTANNIIANKTAKKVACRLGYIGNRKRDLGITNLGVIKMQTDNGNYKVKNVIFVPPSISYTQHIIGISTINDRITVTYHGMNKEEENGWFKELICILSL